MTTPPTTTATDRMPPLSLETMDPDQRAAAEDGACDPHVLAERLSADLTDCTISGARRAAHHDDMAPQFADGIPTPTAKDIDDTAAGLVEIVERVRAHAPHARVLLVDYLTVIGDDTAPGSGIPFEPAEITAFHEIHTALEKPTWPPPPVGFQNDSRRLRTRARTDDADPIPTATRASDQDVTIER